MVPRVVIGEAPVLLENSLASQFSRSGRCTVLDTHSEVQALSQAVTLKTADLALLDMNTLRGAGPETVRQLKLDHRPLRVLVLCADVSRATLRSILQAGADGYVVQLQNFEQLLDLTCAVAAGASYFSDEIAEAFREAHVSDSQYEVNDPGAWHLDSQPMLNLSHPADIERTQITHREAEILNMVAVGCSSKLIADRLFISVPTVRKHRENLMRKLGLHNTAAVTAYAIANGLSLPP
jgi:DNA-binding NarL/FixJ family response regulator